MIARLIEGFKRRLAARRARRDRREFAEVKDFAAYYADQVANLNVEIDARYTELQGLVLIRNTFIAKRDAWEATQAQLEAQYRTS